MRSGGIQTAVLSGVKEQRGQVGGFVETLDTADENQVVATGVCGFVGDFKGGAAIREDRGATGACLPGQAGEAVGGPGGEAIGKVLLAAR